MYRSELGGNASVGREGDTRRAEEGGASAGGGGRYDEGPPGCRVHAPRPRTFHGL